MYLLIKLYTLFVLRNKIYRLHDPTKHIVNNMWIKKEILKMNVDFYCLRVKINELTRHTYMV